MKNFAGIAILLSAAFGLHAEDIVSPNGLISASVSDGGLAISYEGQNVLNIPEFGVIIGQTPYNLDISEVSSVMPVVESYDMLVGKKSHYTNEANSYILKGDKATIHNPHIELRLYNDGVAYRYILDNLNGVPVTDEMTAYFIPEGTPRWIQKWTQPYEEFFPRSLTGDTLDHKWGYPALIEPRPGVFALISEADIKRHHAASYLTNTKEEPALYKVTTDGSDVPVSGRWTSPWRTVIIGDLPAIVESTLITDVSTPSVLADTDWIQPGSVSWIYWAYNHGSNDYQIVTKYIDMAETLGLPYVLIDAEWDEMTNGGTIEDAVAYALLRGVKPLIWYNSSTAWTKQWGAPGPHERLNRPEDREAEFAKIADMGVAGVKIDFFDGDKQETMQYCIDLLESAARHGLLVNFHGATIPRGWQRTYPNLMTVEAVYGAEWYNNLPVLTNRAAAHNATLPFTRNVIGPMDYTPCTFSDSQHPHITTNAHELALPVLFESPLLHWADRPESYLAQPAQVQHLISTLPTVWDDTRLLGGYPGQYVVMARRSGDAWYVAAINGLDIPQDIALDWCIINPDVAYDITTYADGEPWEISNAEIMRTDLPKNITLKPRGGYVTVLKPVNK